MLSIIDTAKSHLGWQEVRDNKILREYFKKYWGHDFNPAINPWCAVYANSVLAESGYVGTKLPNARSFLSFGKKVELKAIQPGDIMIFSRGKNSWEGHVTFFHK